MATPTRAKRRFGALLRELRGNTPLTAEQVTLELKGKGPMVSRYETGEAKPSWGTVLTMLAIYQVTDEQKALASQLWDEVNEEPRSVRLPTGANSAYRKLINAEREATTERIISPYVLPGLLQIDPYIRALVGAGHRLQKHRPRPGSLVDARLKRQERLSDDLDPLTLVALVDESAIRRTIGGAAVSRQQLAHLLVVAERPNITLRIIPFEVGAYGTMNGSCLVIDYPEPDPSSAVYLEYPAGGSWVDNPEDVQRFNSMFDEVNELAHDLLSAPMSMAVVGPFDESAFTGRR